MIGFLLLTSLTVSIDSFACGFSLALLSRKKLPILLGITLTVFLMCLIANYSATLISLKFTDSAVFIGGIILFLLGLYNLINKDKIVVSDRYGNLLPFIVGFAVGIDGAISNLSLSIMGLNSIFVPLTIALFHAVMIALGILLASSPVKKLFNKLNFLPPVILMLLGLFKALKVFI